jgi:hypothetical protein
MLSRISLKWKWYDWLFVAIAVIVIVGAIRVVAPNSGLSQSLHQGFHAWLWVYSGLPTACRRWHSC